MKQTLQHLIAILLVGLLGLSLAAWPAVGQVVETEPSPVQTDQPFTIFFDANQGNGGLAGFAGDVYAYTGLITEESTSQSDWQYVKPAQFGALREDSKLERVGPDRYKLEVENIRSFYSDNDTGSGFILPDEEIEQIAILFYGPGGAPVGRDVDDGDIFIEVEDVGDDRPLVLGRFAEPQIDPLNPFISSRDSICKGKTHNELVNFIYNEDGHYLIIEHVPAEVCDICGERTFSPEVTDHILELAHNKIKPQKIVNVPVFDYALAS